MTEHAHKPAQTLAAQSLIARAHLPSPLGMMTALATEKGLAALLFEGDRYHPDHQLQVPERPNDPALKAARTWLDAYWSGQAADALQVPLDLAGSAFQKAVWQVLLRIPTGQTWTYGDVARHIHPPTAPRATGSAIGRNPVAVLVPCHRVIGANGALTGYASGLPRKLRLLEHEKVLLI